MTSPPPPEQRPSRSFLQLLALAVLIIFLLVLYFMPWHSGNPAGPPTQPTRERVP